MAFRSWSAAHMRPSNVSVRESFRFGPYLGARTFAPGCMGVGAAGDVPLRTISGRFSVHGHPKSRVFEAGRFRLRIWVQNDRKKIRLHRQPLFGRGPAFYYPKRSFEWLTREGANIPGLIDAQPKPGRFRGREGCQNDRMVPNYPRAPAHVSTCSVGNQLWNMRP